FVRPSAHGAPTVRSRCAQGALKVRSRLPERSQAQDVCLTLMDGRAVATSILRPSMKRRA
ncbi:MAG: hypothetical protein WAW39_05270, partial [Prosthecobacter sp.]|uniref:hypothetical protein n=1 Tax=Prosthecobacter sp. TaxID=1965333 RepID=UPI003BAF18A8